jgi:hypothetical protein
MAPQRAVHLVAHWAEKWEGVLSPQHPAESPSTPLPPAEATLSLWKKTWVEYVNIDIQYVQSE